MFLLHSHSQRACSCWVRSSRCQAWPRLHVLPGRSWWADVHRDRCAGVPSYCASEHHSSDLLCTAWCSEIGSLWSLDAPELHASVTPGYQFHCTSLYKRFSSTRLKCSETSSKHFRTKVCFLLVLASNRSLCAKSCARVSSWVILCRKVTLSDHHTKYCDRRHAGFKTRLAHVCTDLSWSCSCSTTTEAVVIFFPLVVGQSSFLLTVAA